MPLSSSFTAQNKIANAALNLAAAKGWKSVTLDAVAKSAKLSAATVKEHASLPHHLIPLIAEMIDREAFKQKTTGAPHDVLFDLLMARFDILQKHRKAILSMAEAARHDRVLSCALIRATTDGAYRLIAAAALKHAPPRPALAAGLTAIYGWAFFVWRKDESRDMAKTMAALDRALRLSGKIYDLVIPRS